MKMKLEDLAHLCADSLNVLGIDRELDDFCEAMGSEHRTLQQDFTKLALRWLYYIGEQEYFDGRNEASVKAGKQVVEALGPCGWALPTV